MRFFADETLAVGASSVGLTRALYDNNGGSSAERAVIQIKDVPVQISFNTDPPSSTASFDANIGDTVTIDGFDNLTQVKFTTKTGGASSIYVGYET